MDCTSPSNAYDLENDPHNSFGYFRLASYDSLPVFSAYIQQRLMCHRTLSQGVIHLYTERIPLRCSDRDKFPSQYGPYPATKLLPYLYTTENDSRQCNDGLPAGS